MNWERVPIVKVYKRIIYGLSSAGEYLFIRIPLKMAGYEWCLICEKKISPKKELKTVQHYGMGYTYDLNYCSKCYEKLK